MVCSSLRLAALGVWIALAGVGFAQTGGGFDLGWASVDAGGGISSGGDYVLGGVVGQPEPIPNTLSGAAYDLLPGFLQDASVFPVPVRLSRFDIE